LGHDVRSNKLIKSVSQQGIDVGMQAMFAHKFCEGGQICIRAIFLIDAFDNNSLIQTGLLCKFLRQIFGHFIIEVASDQLLTTPCSRTLLPQHITDSMYARLQVFSVKKADIRTCTNGTYVSFAITESRVCTSQEVALHRNKSCRKNLR